MTSAVEIAPNDKSYVLSGALADRIDLFLQKEQDAIVFGLCILAAIRIFVFSAAFPIFNYIDEQFHFDTVYEYVKGVTVSQNLPTIEPEVARILTLYESPEYINSANQARQARLDIPIEQIPPQLRDFQYHRIFDYWTRQSNSEAHSPPFYYMVAAEWYRLGQFFGAQDRALVYWVRFFNVLTYSLFVWVSYLFVKKIYPEDNFLCIAVPALIAVFPQDVFFGINRDVLSPLLAATILLLLFLSLQPRATSDFFLIVAGFLVGLSFLTDLSNFVLFGALAIICYIRVREVINGNRPRRGLVSVTAAVGVASVPALIWMAHNRAVSGDLTGSKAKLAMLGWTMRPWPELGRHPLFSLQGSFYFLKNLMISYWRGENHWHGRPMGLPIPDAFYAVTSYLFLLLFVVYLIRNKSAHPLQKLNGMVCVSLLVLSVLFLAVLSLLFDFHQCVYPSRALPYFVSGRIISGTLLPFVIIYSVGFEYLLKRFRSFFHPMIPLALFCLFIVIAQFVACSEIFQSRFNCFAF
jgi:hypothetical protein